jgi:hypothetical protein
VNVQTQPAEGTTRRGGLSECDGSTTSGTMRYKIVVNGLTVYYRQGFCTYTSAIASLQNSWLKVQNALDGEEL